jgi:hypothetical protein
LEDWRLLQGQVRVWRPYSRRKIRNKYLGTYDIIQFSV